MMGSTGVTESTESLKFICAASNYRLLLGIVCAAVWYAAKIQMSHVQVKLKQAVNHEYSIGRKEFCIDPDLAVLISLDGKPFAEINDEHEHIFISLPQCNCIKVQNGKLQYPNGEDIDDLKVFADQKFYSVITNAHFPRNVNNVPVLKQHNKFLFYAEPKKSQAPQGQLDAKPTLKP